MKVGYKEVHGSRVAHEARLSKEFRAEKLDDNFPTLSPIARLMCPHPPAVQPNASPGSILRDRTRSDSGARDDRTKEAASKCLAARADTMMQHPSSPWRNSEVNYGRRTAGGWAQDALEEVPTRGCQAGEQALRHTEGDKRSARERMWDGVRHVDCLEGPVNQTTFDARLDPWPHVAEEQCSRQ